ncbi:MAG: ABC transporter ATP-binding protein [Phycisphaerae bacterium]|nr:ABC transporter ATP-binding protein [Phycisphaerae bacterium]MDW8263431.1 ABC transporter ATP-binding protein [Phycisphaerales bacterium]
MLLKVSDITVSYGAVKALHGLSLEVNEGEIVTLIGCNGAGKSTTLRAISGMIAPRNGSIAFLGEDITGAPPHLLVQQGLSHVPEGRGIFSNLTVAENLDLGAYARKDRQNVAADRERALTLFPRVRERLKQIAGTLSGGEQQMLAIARALLARPRLLLLDEPSLGLAPQLVQLIFSIIREINNQGTTILLVEQNAHMALAVAHRAYVIQTGQILKSGRAKDLLEDPDVKRAYLGG